MSHHQSINLLLIAGTLRVEGMGRANLELIKQLVSHPGINLTVLAPRSSNDLEVPDNVVVHEIPSLYTITSIVDLIWYSRVVLRHRRTADIVHFVSDFPNYLLISYMLRKPYIITAHGTYSVKGLTQGWKRRLILDAFTNASAVHCVSAYTRSRIRQLVPTCDTIVIPHAIDFQILEDAKNEIIQDCNYLLSVGQVKPRKGLHVALEAFGHIAGDYPELSYKIIGSTTDKQYLGQLRSIIQKYHIQDRVKFYGQVSERELRSLSAHSSIYLQPSINEFDNFEGYGLVFLEAGVYHKPTIGTYGSGIEDAIVHEHTGLLVEEKNVKQTEHALRRLLSDRTLLLRLGEGNFNKTSSQTWPHVLPSFLDMYEKVLVGINEVG